MAVIFSVDFPFGQYHATAWERDHNEGEVEWPPSPWRVLRSLVAAWHITAPDLTADDVESAISKLQDPPEFHLPEMRPSHTRHYFPSRNNRADAPGKNRDMVFDAFANFDAKKSFLIHWPDIELDEQDRLVLKRLATGVRYLGRAESPCDMSMIDDLSNDGLEEWLPTEGIPHDLSDVPLLVCRSEQVLADLSVTTHAARKKGLRIPKGSAHVTYRKSETAPGSAGPVQNFNSEIDVVMWALTGKGRPNAKQTLAVTDSLRAAVMGRYGKMFDARSRFLSGRSSDDNKLTDKAHSHAHYLALSSDGKLIDRIAVWSPKGFPSTADEEGRHLIQTLSGLSWLTPGRGGKSFPEQTLALLGMGPSALLGEVASKATTFTSSTPYVPTRYPKANENLIDHVRENVRQELSSRGHPEPRTIEVLLGEYAGWRRSRPRRSNLGSGPTAVRLQIEFGDPISGPILIGRFSHFGFGLFMPAKHDR